MSCSGGGVLLVTDGSTVASKKSGSSRASSASSVSPGCCGNRAPPAAASWTARAKASRAQGSTNLRAVRLLYGLVLIHKDVAAGNGCLRQVPDQCLLPERQIAKAVGVDLDDRRLADAFEEVG